MPTIKKILLTTLLLLIICSGSAQNQRKIDSLEAVLKTEEISDSIRIGTNYELARKYLNSDPGKTLFYTSQAIELAEKGANRYSKKKENHSASRE